MTSATNEAAIKARTVQQKKDRATTKEVISALLSRVDGRRYLWLQLEAASVFTSYSSLDHATMAFREGQRNTGLALLASITSTSPEMFVQMLRENSGVKIKEQDNDGPIDAIDGYDAFGDDTAD